MISLGNVTEFMRVSLGLQVVYYEGTLRLMAKPEIFEYWKILQTNYFKAWAFMGN